MTLPTTLGSSDAPLKSHAAFHKAMKNIFRRNQLGDGPRRNREHDKPAMLGTKRSATDTPTETHDDIRFDYEMRDPLSVFGLNTAGIALTLLTGSVLMLLL